MMETDVPDAIRRRLARMFRDQERFAQGYAPLSSRVFGLVADWLEADGALEDPVVAWLIAAAADKQPLQITLLLLAALHRDVLAAEQAVAELARFFPTMDGDPTQPGLEPALRTAILARQDVYGAFLRRTGVQTNETGRGLCWLLPLSLTGWPAVHLVDLGASAGLNLLADQRHYRLEGTDGAICQLGSGPPGQFVAHVRGPLRQLCRQLRPLPRLLTRLGGDRHPYLLRSADDEHTLLSFVWADHVDRLRRLREAIALQKSFSGPFALRPLTLPEGLGAFLERHVPSGAEPVVITNTVVTAYLAEQGDVLDREMSSWAESCGRTVLWLQWEPYRAGQDMPPERYAWTLDIWSYGRRQHVFLGWVHPHGGRIELADAFPSWGSFDKIH